MDISAILSIIAVAISGIALIISWIVVWNKHYSPFNVKIYCGGSPRIEPIPQQLEDGGTVGRFYAVLPLYFENTGARYGVIRDILLVVNSDQNKWLFKPAFYTKYSLKTELTLGATLTTDPSNEPFYYIHLAGKSMVFKSIVFVLEKHEKFPFGTNPLLAGNYSFAVMALEGDKEEYETKLVFNINLNEESIADFSKGVIYFPFLKEIIDKRQQISS
jgi:hypothetical protein